MEIFLYLRLNTGYKSEAIASMFFQASPNTLFGAIYQNNMDNSSFMSYNKSLSKTIYLPQQAFFGLSWRVLNNPEAACKVNMHTCP